VNAFQHLDQPIAFSRGEQVSPNEDDLPELSNEHRAVMPNDGREARYGFVQHSHAACDWVVECPQLGVGLLVAGAGWAQDCAQTNYWEGIEIVLDGHDHVS
jgi:hypothetical protein